MDIAHTMEMAADNASKLQSPTRAIEPMMHLKDIRKVTSNGQGEALNSNCYTTLGPGNMAASGLRCRKPLVSPGWAISLLVFWACRPSISGIKTIVLLCRDDHWPRAVTVASSLDSGCDLSLVCTEDGCSSTCVKLEASKPT